MQHRIQSMSEDEQILTLIKQYPLGASLQEISENLPESMPRRTLQRRLSALVDQAILTRVGSGSAVRYSIAQTEVQALTYDINYSPEALEIEHYVNQHVSKRRPVGYQREFLESYQPNKTFYLPEKVRQDLQIRGQQNLAEKPAGTFARKILDRLLIDISWNSSRLEGNTYSLLETQRLIQFGEMAHGKTAFESQMILNHKAAIQFLIESIDDIHYNLYTICSIHALLSENLLGNTQASGRLRKIPVGISHTVYHPLEIPQLIEEYLSIILQKVSQINDPFEQAFFLMVHIPYLQAFEDVNKRVSRLAANISLIKNNLCPLSFIDVPDKNYIDGMIGVYELNRIELLRDLFVWSYNRSVLKYSAIQHSLGEPDRFKMRYREEIKTLIREIILGLAVPSATSSLIQNWADVKVELPDRKRFVEVVENELLSLHLGNIVLYRITPEQFKAWQEIGNG